MRLYTDTALQTAKDGALEIVAKLASLTPTDKFTLDDIRKAIFYLKDYSDECRSLQTKRKLKRMGYGKKETERK